MRAPPVRTHGPTRCTSPARTHAALQQARGQAGPFWTEPACQRRPRRRGVCVPRRRPRPGTDHGHSHAQQLRVRSGQRTHRVWLCAITRKKTARTHRGRNPHACCRPPAALCACVERRHERAGRTTPPTKAAHPLAAVVHEGVSPAAGAAAPASRAASPARGWCIPAPGRHADAL